MAVLNRDEYAIALHTSTPQLGITINNYGGDCRTQVWDLGRDLASSLHQYLQSMIEPQTWQNIKFIAVAKGPGGFTGTRVGIVTARTIAQQLDIPIFGISNLAAIALAQQDTNNDLVAVQMDARRDQVFVGIYQKDLPGQLTEYLTDTLISNEAWQATLNNLSSPYKLIVANENISATVTNILDLAHADWKQGKQSHWSEVKPFYGQDPVNQT